MAIVNELNNGGDRPVSSFQNLSNFQKISDSNSFVWHNNIHEFEANNFVLLNDQVFFCPVKIKLNEKGVLQFSGIFKGEVKTGNDIKVGQKAYLTDDLTKFTNVHTDSSLDIDFGVFCEDLGDGFWAVILK